MSSIPLSFVGAVNIAVRLVTEKYPDAQLLEALATTSNNSYVKSPVFSHLRVIFHVEGGTAFIDSTVWGEFGPISYVPEPWVGDFVIPWPVHMDTREADDLLKKAGYTAPYDSTLLRHPVYPGLEEPYYIFRLQTEGFIFVGTNSKKVFPADQGTLEVVERSISTLRSLGE